MKKSIKPTTKQLEDKFEETAFRLSQERNDFFMPQIVDFVKKDKWINLRPEYQRRLVWDDQKRSLFIESLLLNVPIPPVFLYEWELGRYEVMDGQQRLNAIVDFYENGYALKGLDKWEELIGLRYKDLPEKIKRGIDRRRLSATVLLVESGLKDQAKRSDLRKLVFERLNTGGQHLNNQELRNCLYSGKLNDLLIELSRGDLFCQVWNIPLFSKNVDSEGTVSAELANNSLYKRMIDSEIVLRFFAFRIRTRVKGSVRNILDKYMEDSVPISDADLSALRILFNDRLEVAHRMFGAHTFQYKTESGSWKASQPMYDAIMISLDRLWGHRSKLIASKKAVAEAISKLLDKEDAFAVVVGRPNTAKAILRRIDLIEKAMRAGAGI